VVRLTRIYTRGGDKGETSLGSGVRVKKHDLRVAAYGTVDEANAAIGLARLHAEGEADAMLARIQNDLFDLGADLCTPADESGGPAGALRIVQAQVDRLEREIDQLNAGLAPLDSFVLPGGRSTRSPSSMSTGCPTTCSCSPASSTTAAAPTCCGSPAPTAEPRPRSLTGRGLVHILHPQYDRPLAFTGDRSGSLCNRESLGRRCRRSAT